MFFLHTVVEVAIPCAWWIWKSIFEKSISAMFVMHESKLHLLFQNIYRTLVPVHQHSHWILFHNFGWKSNTFFFEKNQSWVFSWNGFIQSVCFKVFIWRKALYAAVEIVSLLFTFWRCECCMRDILWIPARILWFVGRVIFCKTHSSQIFTTCCKMKMFVIYLSERSFFMAQKNLIVYGKTENESAVEPHNWSKSKITEAGMHIIARFSKLDMNMVGKGHAVHLWKRWIEVLLKSNNLDCYN